MKKVLFLIAVSIFIPCVAMGSSFSEFDVNQDGNENSVDLALVFVKVFYPSNNYPVPVDCDVNHNGWENERDWAAISKVIIVTDEKELLFLRMVKRIYPRTHSFPGDTNRDWEVNICDIRNIAKVFGQTVERDNSCDQDGNKRINVFDLVGAGTRFGAKYIPTPALAPSSYTEEDSPQKTLIATWAHAKK